MATGERTLISSLLIDFNSKSLITKNIETTSLKLVNNNNSTGSIQPSLTSTINNKNSSGLLPYTDFLDYQEYIEYLIRNGVPGTISGSAQNMTITGLYNNSIVSGSISGIINGDLEGTLSVFISGTNLQGIIRGTISGTVLCQDITSNQIAGIINGTMNGRILNNIFNANLNGVITKDQSISSPGLLLGNISGQIDGSGNRLNSSSVSAFINHKLY